jgi:hypothetical protein
MLAKDCPADDEALKIVVVERAVAVLRRLCKDGSVVSIFRRRHAAANNHYDGFRFIAKAASRGT